MDALARMGVAIYSSGPYAAAKLTPEQQVRVHCASHAVPDCVILAWRVELSAAVV